MATAAPLPPMAVPLGVNRANTCRTKQKEQLDVALLCNKLEAHKREQDDLKQQKQRHDAKQRGLFVPRSAARQFTMTATPLKDDIDPTKLRWNGQNDISSSHPPDLDDGLHLNPKQKYAALRLGMTETEVLAAATALHNPAPASSSRRGSRQDGEAHAPTTAKRPSEPREPLPLPESENADAPSGPTAYKPGDSARRRSSLHERSTRHPEFSAAAAAARRRSGANFDVAVVATIPAFRQGRDELNEMPYDLPMRGEGVGEEGMSGRRSCGDGIVGRPKLAPHDRHNWAQQSQCGDDFRRAIRLPGKLGRKEKEGEKGARDARRGSEGVEVEPRRNSESLIADAVKAIKKEEKRRRHESFKAFFKRS